MPSKGMAFKTKKKCHKKVDEFVHIVYIKRALEDILQTKER